MSVATQISRIKGEKSKIAIKLSNMGLAETTASLETLADAINDITDNGAVTATVRQGELYTIPKGYHNGSGTVTGLDNPEADSSKYMLQTKTITPTKEQKSVTPDQGYYGLSSVTVNAIPAAYQDVTQVDATKDEVLVGKKIVSKDGTVVVGEMPNRGAVNVDLGTITPRDGFRTYGVPVGYHNGGGSVRVAEGAYSLTTSNGGVQEATVDAEGLNIDLTEIEEGQPSEGSTQAYIKVSGNVDGFVRATASIDKAGYVEEGSQFTDEHFEVSPTPKYYRVKDGTVNVTGGGLSKGAGSASATITGANFSLTPSTSQPASGKKYITATGSGTVNRAAIGYKTTAGIVYNGEVDGEDLKENNLGNFGATSETSNSATKYYTIPDTVADTASGTAFDYHILKGQKAWVDGNEVTGTMNNFGDMGIREFNPLVENYWSLGSSGYVADLRVGLTDDLENELATI